VSKTIIDWIAFIYSLDCAIDCVNCVDIVNVHMILMHNLAPMKSLMNTERGVFQIEHISPRQRPRFYLIGDCRMERFL